jgi:hypothetical protein
VERAVTEPEKNSGVEEYVDPVIAVYMNDVDRTLLRENLKLTPDERFKRFRQFMNMVKELREAGQRHRGERV